MLLEEGRHAHLVGEEASGDGEGDVAGPAATVMTAFFAAIIIIIIIIIIIVA